MGTRMFALQKADHPKASKSNADSKLPQRTQISKALSRRWIRADGWC